MATNTAPGWLDQLDRAVIDCGCGARWVVKARNAALDLFDKIESGAQPRYLRGNGSPLGKPDGARRWMIDLRIGEDFG